MADAIMAYPDLRHPFDEKPIHPQGSATVLYQGRTIILSEIASGDGLLINPDDLPRVNGFELKPQGACYAELCVPMNDDLLVEEDGRQWFNLEAFADLLGQPYVADKDGKVWSFAEMPTKSQSTLVDGMAPDFEVTDRAGKVIRMTDLKGKKALIVTWSSW
jgi:hypothetical protein